MIRIRRSGERGHADHGWLETYHTFSFAGYHDPAHMGFGPMRVLNQDRVAPRRGFATHGHRDMEIVSYVLDGVLEHRDSLGHGSQMRPGEVQLMSAGTGVTHSEFSASDESLHFLQMWIVPEKRGTEPRYEQREFPADERRGAMRLVVSPDGIDDSLRIGQDARMFAGLLDDDERVRHELGVDRAAWLHVARGALDLDGHRLASGDGAAIDGSFDLCNGDGAEFVLWELPADGRVKRR